MDRIEAILADERNLSGPDYFLLWAGAAVSLAEIWAGGLLISLGLATGILVIVLGHVVGNFPMAWGGLIGSKTGLPTMVIVRPSFGERGSYFAASLNVIQLVGWTAVMLWIGGHAAAAVGGVGPRFWMLVLGVVTTIWAVIGHRHWKWLHRVAVTALLFLCIVMSVVILREYGWSQLAQARGKQGLSFMLGLDLVIAMPISWLPLVCDYSRYSRGARSCFWGTWIGYFLVSSWMYIIGLAAALATSSTTPDAVVIQMMASIGMVLPAVLIVLFSTITTTFLDIFSTAISAMNIRPALGERGGCLAAGALGLAAALVFPAVQYENFLLFIGSMFCPLFGVVLADFFVLRDRSYLPEQFFTRGTYWYRAGVNPMAFVAWAAGFAVYQLASSLVWPVGASLPSFLLAGAAYLILMRCRPAKNKAVT